jgi:hypothetical protein
MKTRLPWAAAIVAVPLLLGVSRPADAQVLVVTAKSVDTLVGDLDYLINAIAPDDDMRMSAQQGLEMLKSPALLAGVDRTKPFGAWASIPAEPGAAEPPSVIVAVPVTDLKALFANLQQNLGLEVDNHPGIPGFSYKVGMPGNPMALYVVEAKGYAYLSLVPNGAEKLAALSPSDWMPKRDGVGDLSISVRLDQLPQPFKDMALAQVEQHLAEERDQKPGEEDAAYRGRLAAMKLSQEAFTQFMRDCRDVNLDLIVDKTKEQVSLDLSVSAQANSGMAKNLAGFTSRSSAFRVLADPASALAGWASVPISPELQGMITRSAAEGFAKAQAEAKNETDKGLIRRAQAIVEEIAKSGSIDLGVAINPVATPSSSGTSALVFGLQVPDARKIEDLMRDAMKSHPPDASEAEVTLDAGKAPDGTSLHRIKPVVKAEEAASVKAFGEPIVYLAFRKNQVLMAVGSTAEAALVKALSQTSKPAPAASGSNPIELRVAVDKVSALADLPNIEALRTESAKAFAGPNAGKNLIVLSLGGAPNDAIRLRLRFDVPALAFLAKFGTSVYQSVGGPPGAVPVPEPVEIRVDKN